MLSENIHSLYTFFNFNSPCDKENSMCAAYCSYIVKWKNEHGKMRLGACDFRIYISSF